MPIDPGLIRDVLLFAAPLLVAGIGELVVERAGVVNIGIEGMMLTGALAAVLGNAMWGPAAGVATAMLAAIVLGALFAMVTLLFSADQIVTGAGINLLALGATGLAWRRLEHTVAPLPLRAIDPWWLVGFALVLAIAVDILFRRTRSGLELTALGESPEAAETAGIPVLRRRLWAVLFGAAAAGLAGSYLSTMRFAGFQQNMTEGDGFLALAIVIFGRWTPGGIVLAALFFGLVRAGAYRLIIGGHYAPEASQLFNMLPYALSLLVLAGAAGRSRSPAALGKVGVGR